MKQKCCMYIANVGIIVAFLTLDSVDNTAGGSFSNIPSEFITNNITSSNHKNIEELGRQNWKAECSVWKLEQLQLWWFWIQQWLFSTKFWRRVQ